MKEIKVEEVRMMPRDSYELIDIRDDGLVAYGMIPGAIHISTRMAPPHQKGWRSRNSLPNLRRVIRI